MYAASNELKRVVLLCGHGGRAEGRLVVSDRRDIPPNNRAAVLSPPKCGRTSAHVIGELKQSARVLAYCCMVTDPNFLFLCITYRQMRYCRTAGETEGRRNLPASG